MMSDDAFVLLIDSFDATVDLVHDAPDYIDYYLIFKCHLYLKVSMYGANETYENKMVLQKNKLRIDQAEKSIVFHKS